MTFGYQIEIQDGVPMKATVLTSEGEYLTAVKGQGNFDAIIDALNDGPDESVAVLFDVEKAVDNAFRKVSDRITVRNRTAYYDGDPINGGVAKALVRLVEEGDLGNLEAVALFTERVMRNPNQHSREQAYTWLEKHNFSITTEGKVVMYKGCRRDADGVLYSTVAAPASDEVTVDGVPVTGYVPNRPGTVVAMARSKVTHNPSEACSAGLHVADFDYAQGYQRAGVVEVHVDPVDFVSVPTDSGGAKFRVCRYEVIGEVSEKHTAAVLHTEPKVTDVTKAESVDTRQNHLKQERYPKGHPLAGRFKPKGS